MIGFLAKKRIPNYQNYENSKVRQAYGNLTSTVGIINNIILFGFKFISGTIVHSVSITADAINNLSDAGSSIISLISFKLSSKPADEKHPFGHARYECIASMIVACLILMLGLELVKTSFDKIIHPEEITFSWISCIILVFSITVKIWMYAYNKKYGKLLHSSIMEATSADSLSDAMSTFAVLVSTIISPLIHFDLDGYVGLVVACFILYAGYGVIRKALDELLGQAPSDELVKKIQEKIMSYDGVLGMHDLMIHDYGAYSTFVSVHVEVDYKVDILKSHDMIDNIEKDFKEEMDIEMVIHMDPINIDDDLTNNLRMFIKNAVKEIDEKLTIHDFRLVTGETHTNLIFDIVVPFHVTYKNQEILDFLKKKLEEKGHKYYLVVTFDRAYTTEFNKE